MRQTCFRMSCTVNTFSRQLNATWQEETDLNVGIDPIIIFEGCLGKFLFSLAIEELLVLLAAFVYFWQHFFVWLICLLIALMSPYFCPGWSLRFYFLERWKRSAQFCTCNELNLWLIFGRSSGLCLTFIAALEFVTVTSSLKTFW